MMHETNHEEIVSTKYWKEEFSRLIQLAPNVTRTQLIQYDSYYLLASTKDDLRHAKNGKAGYEKLRRLIPAIEKYIAAQRKDERLNQKLIKDQRLVLRA